MKKVNSTLFVFMRCQIEQLALLGKERTSRNYAATLRSFMRFRKGEDVRWSKLDAPLIQQYEAYLRNRVSLNTSSFYLRVLKAVYNRAVEAGLVIQIHPFRRVYTGVCKTRKRAVSLAVIQQLKSFDLSRRPALRFARDIFLFSFYTRGMAFVDVAHLLKSNLRGSVLTYSRRKTSQELHIRWEPCMQNLVTCYGNPDSPYLLNIIRPGSSKPETLQYLNAMARVNEGLKKLSALLHLAEPLTFYAARHSWASIARHQNIPLSVISRGMGHDSEKTTRIYLDSLDSNAVDAANRRILKKII